MSGGDVGANHKKMLDTPVSRLIPVLSVQTVITMLAGAAYNITDTYFVSGLGESRTGAVGIIFSITAMIQTLGFAWGMGAASIISRMLGGKKNEQANDVAVRAVKGAAISEIIMAAFCLCALKPLVIFLGATDTMTEPAGEYGRYILLAAPVMGVAYVLNNILRAQGMPIWALMGIVLGGIINAILDPVLIFQFHMDIRGAGIATLVGQAASLVVMCCAFFCKKSIVRITLIRDKQKKTDTLTTNEKEKKADTLKVDKRKGRADSPDRTKKKKETNIYAAILKQGMPSFWRQGLVCLAAILTNRSIKAYGDEALAAMSVANKIFALVFAAFVGYGQGYAPVAGYSYGAGDYRRVKKATWFSIWSGLAVCVLAAVLIYVWTPNLLGIFGFKGIEASKDSWVGVLALRTHAISLPFLVICLMTGMLFQAIGMYGKATVISTARQGIFFLPLIWLLPHILGALGVAITQPAADVLAGIFSIPFLIVGLKKLKSNR